MKGKVLKMALNQGLFKNVHYEARHGRGLEGLLKRYFK